MTIFTFTLGIIAPACGFTWGNNSAKDGSFIEICTAQGIEKRFITSEGSNENSPSNNQSPHKAKNQCQFCFAASNLQALTPIGLSIEVSYAYAIKQIYGQYEVILLSKDTTHEQPRGPPILV